MSSGSTEKSINTPIYLCKMDEIVDMANDERASQQVEVLATILTKLGYTLMSGEEPHFDELWAAHRSLQ